MSDRYHNAKKKEDANYDWVGLPDNWRTLNHSNQLALLDQMRGCIVVGQCSQDTRPHEHAVNIALVSAETYKWEVFLKAHLDIMNDRFERMSDGSYAWGKRQTYIRELEQLNIDVKDLLLGISFRIDNPANYHYFVSIGRLGRALAESEDRQLIEESILTIIKDQKLDYYNRMIFYFLYKHYSSYLSDKNKQEENDKSLALAAETFPVFLR